MVVNDNDKPAGDAQKKTTPDEGRTFNEDKVFECVTDCWTDEHLYHRGDKITGRKCPAHFVVTDIKPEKEKE